MTLSRIVLMSSAYNNKYLFLSSEKTGYQGKYLIDDKPEILNGMTVSEAILSPTRQWAIVIKRIIEKLKARNKLSLLHGISMNTGGGATKIGHVGKGILFKKKMPTPPEIFQLIKKESNIGWEEMFEDFNCGIGIDVVGEDNPEFRKILEEVSEEVHIKMFDLGICEQFKKGKNKIELDTPYGLFNNY